VPLVGSYYMGAQTSVLSTWQHSHSCRSHTSYKIIRHFKPRMHKISKNLWSQNFWCQKGDMRQVPYEGPKNIMRHRTEFSSHGD